MTQRKARESEIRERFERLQCTLTERSRRLFAGSEALAFGYGGIAATSRATGLSHQTVLRGLQECQQIESGVAPVLEPHRSRVPGGGRKKLTEKHPQLLPTLKKLLESTTRGDPESPLLWTARSQRNLVAAMKEKGYSLSKHTLAKLLQDLGYSLQGNKKCLEGAQHPDRNAQFQHINETVRRQLEAGNPAISVDTKKKELVGNYKNTGRELRLKGQPEPVNTHDFPDKEMGKAVPYGVYDLAENEAWVSVGVSHDTAEFAVETIRSWYRQLGQALYPNASNLLIMADSGGSNGYRLRLWKFQLQALADHLRFPITVCHLPPGTSKWNKIEHRLFSFITQNWRGKPLVSHQVIVELIAATKTKTGLKVYSRLDQRIYATGQRISDKQLADVNLEPDAWHGEWNYTIQPNDETNHES
ncbi:MAG: ISAzo13 family transposase [Arenicellales bacterium]|nr:ISAzo13 family transposase [Arenicellales bacterium]